MTLAPTIAPASEALIHGDCLDVMPTLAAGSVDAVVTDPPYDLTGHRWDSLGQGGDPKQTPHVVGRGGFMGRKWDGTGIAFKPETWAAALRVTKPGGYLLAFGGTRTYHRMTVAIEDAGWIIRDCLVWVYASGFPKSRALLKPAWEPIVMARKPGPLRELAIDACRIPGAVPSTIQGGQRSSGGFMNADGGERGTVFDGSPLGRWPANVLLTDPIFDGDTPGVVGGGEASYNPAGVFGQQRGNQPTDTAAAFAVRRDGDGIFGYGDSGTYSRFFLVPKSARSEREPVLPSGLASRLGKIGNHGNLSAGDDLSGKLGSNRPRRNSHPTVKPLDLMRHLVRLVTPTGGTVLDCFAGSGTTLLAAEMEGFRWVGIEREAEYCEIAKARLNGTQRGLGLETA